MTSKKYWTAGNAASWAVGVTLGLILGIALLIAIPRMMAKPVAADAPQTPAAVAATGDSSGAAASTEKTEETTTAATTEEPAKSGETASAGEGNAEAGKTFFTGTCAGCHGAEAQGGGVGPSLREAAGWSEAELTAAVHEGKAPDKELSAVMPHFTDAQVSAQQLADVHAYLKSLN